jgi:hypothetical protein
MGMYTSARISKARPKDSTSALISGNEISNSRNADSKARHLLCLLQQLTNKTLLQPFMVPNRSLDSINSCAQPRRHVMDEMALNSFIGFP